MLDISAVRVAKVIVHQVGNKLRDEGYSLSNREVLRTPALDELILRRYVGPVIGRGDIYDFYHESDLSLNEIRHFSQSIFSDNKNFRSGAQSIAKHLYSASTHPNIIGGEFIVALFNDVRVDGTAEQAIGLFRIEGKDDYLDVVSEDGSIQLVERAGISLEKIQKGAIVVSGSLKIYAVDALSQRTKYWLDAFLKAVPAESPKTCTRAAGAFLKAVSQKVTSPISAIEFGKKLQESLERSDDISMGQIKKLSAKYLKPSEINQIFSGIRDRVGLDVSDDAQLDVKQLNRYAKEVVKKARIADGVSLLIAKQNAHVIGMEVKNIKGGIRAVIDIKVDEE